ncbi:MAG: sel1 repeat family protein, partial [Synergistaceae bacterium]|nr:sel1 repeat family protein [Synergistaceae bacterium]
QGNLKAAYYLGTLYQNAQGVPQNYEEAAEWYKLAVNPNDNKAQLALGYLYRNGLGVEKNDSTADEFFEQAERFEKIKDLMSSGIKYTQGREDTRDYVRAMECFKEAYRMGETKAPYYIGMMYKDGLGIEKNYRKAEEWFRKAEDLGDKRAAKVLKWLSENPDLLPPLPPSQPEIKEPEIIKEIEEAQPEITPAPSPQKPEPPKTPEPPIRVDILKPVPLSQVQRRPHKKKPDTPKKKGSSFKVIMFFAAFAAVFGTGFYLYRRITNFIKSDDSLTSLIQDNILPKDENYFGTGIPDFNAISADLPGYVKTTGTLRHDTRYINGIADITAYSTRLYKMPDERSNSIENTTGIKWLFEDSMNRIKRFRKVADDFTDRYDNMIRVRGTWQQAKDSGYSENIWRRYYREEQNLLAKKQSALKAVSMEINNAKERIKSAQTLNYLGEWINPDGKKWTLVKLNFQEKPSEILWVNSNYVRLMTLDEYRSTYNDSLKLIGELPPPPAVKNT